MRFTSAADYSTILKFNRELINTVIDTPAIIYKLHIEGTKTNIYGEGTSKEYYVGVQVPCLIDRQDAEAITEMIGTLDFEQDVTFAFLKVELEDRGVYPEVGDIIEFDSQYFEIDTANEVQLFAGQVAYNHQIFCSTHMMRKSPTNLERPIV